MGQVLKIVRSKTCVLEFSSWNSWSGTSRTTLGAVTIGMKGKSLNWVDAFPSIPIKLNNYNNIQLQSFSSVGAIWRRAKDLWPLKRLRRYFNVLLFSTDKILNWPFPLFICYYGLQLPSCFAIIKVPSMKTIFNDAESFLFIP